MPDTRNARLFDFMSEREDIKREVTDRVVTRIRRQANLSEEKALEYVLNEAAYLEMQRLSKGSTKLDLRPYGFWHHLARRLGKATQVEKARILRELTAGYSEDVAGKFTPQVYWFATSVLPLGLSVILNAQSIDTLLRNFRQLGERIRIEGHLEQLRKLAGMGTLVVVPTHSSNLDSVVVGWCLEEAQLPPVTYGAGKNLFTNKLLSFFMHNLGAYKVDRRISNTIYKNVLKTYSEVLLERGYHQLFFPGGTRSRSNHVESKLKLGLLGTALSAYTNNLIGGRERPKVFICPLTINYQLVLEGETLIAEHLRRDGGARFIIEDDEFSDITKVTKFSMNMLGMEYNLVLRFGAPFDPLGNPVDNDGNSIDPQGRVVDLERYMWIDGQVAADPLRDAEYTRDCGRAIAAAFKRETVVLSGVFLAFVLFQYLREAYPQLDLYRLLRVAKGEHIPFDVISHRAERLHEALKALYARGGIQLSDPVRDLAVPDLVEHGTSVLKTYHTTPVIESRTNGLEVSNPNLLYFYGNRLANYGLEDKLLTGRVHPGEASQ